MKALQAIAVRSPRSVSARRVVFLRLTTVLPGAEKRAVHRWFLAGSGRWLEAGDYDRITKLAREAVEGVSCKSQNARSTIGHFCSVFLRV